MWGRDHRVTLTSDGQTWCARIYRMETYLWTNASACVRATDGMGYGGRVSRLMHLGWYAYGHVEVIVSSRRRARRDYALIVRDVSRMQEQKDAI